MKMLYESGDVERGWFFLVSIGLWSTSGSSGLFARWDHQQALPDLTGNKTSLDQRDLLEIEAPFNNVQFTGENADLRALKRPGDDDGSELIEEKKIHTIIL